MTRAHVTACAAALMLTAGAPSSVPIIDDGDKLSVPPHVITAACGALKQEADIADCIKTENIQHNYMINTWGLLTIDEQKEANASISSKGGYYDKFYRDLARYIEVKLRSRQHLDRGLTAQEGPPRRTGRP